MFKFTEEDLKKMHPIEAAAIRVMEATDSRGLKIRLCDPLDLDSIKAAIQREEEKLDPQNIFVSLDGAEQDQEACRRKVRQNLGLLRALLHAHKTNSRAGL